MSKKSQFYVIKKSGAYERFDAEKIFAAIEASAERAMVDLTEEQKWYVVDTVKEQLENRALTNVPVDKVHNLVELALDDVSEKVATSYRTYRDRNNNLKNKVKHIFNETERIMYSGDKENANKDSQLNSTQGALIRDAFMEEYYIETFLTEAEKKALALGAFYLHDKAQRPFMMNCCLFRAGKVLKNGFEMGNLDYTEPKSLSIAFEVIGDIVLGAASQQYGGFTIPEVDKILAPYAKKSYDMYVEDYTSFYDAIFEILDESKVFSKITSAVRKLVDNKVKKLIDKVALKKVKKDFRQGWQGWEMKFNTVASSRGDYPFITVTMGLSTDEFGKMCAITGFEVHQEGQGKPGHKKPVLFPKYVFLYDQDLHDEGKVNNDVYKAAVSCSDKVMYPDWLSLTQTDDGIEEYGASYVPGVYKGSWNGETFKPGTVISPMGCRAFLSPYFKIGKLTGELDEDGNEIRDHFYAATDVEDEFIAEGRFNSGAISLNLPLIYLEAVANKQSFYSLLDEYLEMIRGIHKRTKRYLGKRRAGTNPLAFCEGGFYGGNLQPNQRLEESFELMDSTTYSFGITALNELQQAFNGHSLVEEEKRIEELNANLEDGEEKRIPFAREVLKYINDKANKFKKEDHMLYAIYGTPAESLCGKQITQLRKFVKENAAELEKEGYIVERKGNDYVIPNICSSEYVTNSFHAKVTEDISGAEKQDLEAKYWNLCNGGKIQYVRYPMAYDKEIVKATITRAMGIGFYEGVNRALNYCDDCGHEEIDMKDVCPICGSKNITKIDRMNGYLAYSRVKGDTRLNAAKMAEIAERKSM